ncbi:helix-turn-helix domain-containing protein [Thalassobellus suaedae]|uniref:Helix-turn-helix domain-containing protein n=1 Tax=Thalassobellus suaedae TaxID=3074124 RepID=A0ABY9Y384_9FLAO|nr:helix-turn-helix domain-containing protein [Flavobacteriaceae bacterium HL-DH10]
MENPFEIIKQRLDRIEKLLEANLGNLCNNKITHSIPTLMTIKDVANYLNLSIPTIYGYTAKKNMPHSKRGNKLYFDKNNINEWILEGRQKTIRDIERLADNYILKNSRHIRNI